MSKKVSVSVALTITLIAITVTFAVTWVVAAEKFNQAVRSVTQKQATYTKLLEVDTYVRNNYYGEINDTVLNDLIVQGYLRGIEDPYATYYTEREYTAMQEYEAGTRAGIGVRVSRNVDGYYYIERVYPDSPAAKADVQTGGRITFVDGVDVKTLTSDSAMTNMLRGEVGTTVALTCIYGNNEERTFEIQRVSYITPTVEYLKCGDFGYIRITAFEKNTSTELDNALLQALADGAKGLVFDVRGNAGGQYQQAYNIIDTLCPQGTVAKSEAKNGTVKVLATSDEENAVDLPMSVLIDANTAAAAELFAVNIRDLSGGSVVGVTSAGKGMLQSPPQQLTDGSAISITTAKLLTGGNESFDGVGVVPDVEALVDDDNLTVNLYNPDPGADPQILRALEVVRSAAGDSELSIRYVAADNETAVQGAEGEDESASASLTTSDTSSENASAASGSNTSAREENDSSSSSESGIEASSTSGEDST